jgi:hypothetical protein
LRFAERRSRRFPTLQHSSVEPLHQVCCRSVVDLPQTGYDARRTRVHEPSCESDQTLSLDLLPDGRLTRAEHDKMRVELQIVDVFQLEKAVLWSSASIDQRQHQTG